MASPAGLLRTMLQPLQPFASLTVWAEKVLPF